MLNKIASIVQSIAKRKNEKYSLDIFSLELYANIDPGMKAYQCTLTCDIAFKDGKKNNRATMKEVKSTEMTGL